jgi:predicted amidophosphoribosyltransferase
VCDAFGGAINPHWLADATLVPIPPSKARNHPEYDDRIARICRAIPRSVDVRELVVQTHSLPADHESGQRQSIENLLDTYAINESIADPRPQNIGIVDDVLTNGTHFRAMKTILQKRFPGTRMVGFFIARRVFPPESPFDAVEL